MSSEKDQFEFSPLTENLNQITRPSLTYWKDAFYRLLKNKRAILSLIIIIVLIFGALFGDKIWTVNPTYMDLSQVSQPPNKGRAVVIVADNATDKLWPGTKHKDLEEEPEEEVDELGKTEKIEVVGHPTTYSVKLDWKPVEGAFGYKVYRSTVPPEGQALGVPVKTIDVANITGFEDRVGLEQKTYYYTVQAQDFTDPSEYHTTIKVTPEFSMKMKDAIELGMKDLKIGEKAMTPIKPFGTDDQGRDILARIIQGGRVSLFIGIVAPLLFIFIGVVYGAVSGFCGGKVDEFMMRFADFVVALPFILFMIIFKMMFGLGPGKDSITPMIVAMVVLSWPASARLVRGQILQIREEAYIQAAQLLGANRFYLIFRHMLPNTMGVILVSITFAVPIAIFTEAFLSFIGLGVLPPTASWGQMCNDALRTIETSPHELIFPSLFISITVLAFNLFGDGLRDALDSKMRSKE